MYLIGEHQNIDFLEMDHNLSHSYFLGFIKELIKFWKYVIDHFLLDSWWHLRNLSLKVRNRKNQYKCIAHKRRRKKMGKFKVRFGSSICFTCYTNWVMGTGKVGEGNTQLDSFARFSSMRISILLRIVFQQT